MRKKIGEIGVDSGQIMITDPCYIDSWEGTEFTTKAPFETQSSYEYSYDGACRATLSPARSGQLANGLGVAVATAYGDGSYPVYAEYNSDGIITSVTISFE